MALTLAKIQGNLAECTFVYDGEAVNIKYRPNVYTPSFLLNLIAIQEQQHSEPTPDLINAVVNMVKQVLSSWDVLGEDGQMWPVTDENLRALPMDFLATLLRAITDDINLGKKTPRP